MSCRQVLEEVKDARYLGVTVSDDLERTKHIDVITSKANSKLSFLSRNLNLMGCPEKLRETAYSGILLPSKVLPRIQRHCLAPLPKIQLRQTGDGAAKGCLFRERQVWNV